MVWLSDDAGLEDVSGIEGQTQLSWDGLQVGKGNPYEEQTYIVCSRVKYHVQSSEDYNVSCGLLSCSAALV